MEVIQRSLQAADLGSPFAARCRTRTAPSSNLADPAAIAALPPRPQVKVLAEKIETAIVVSIWITLEPELLVSPWLRVWVPTIYATRRYS